MRLMSAVPFTRVWHARLSARSSTTTAWSHQGAGPAGRQAIGTRRTHASPSGYDRASGVVTFEAAHRPQPRFESAVVTCDAVVRVLLGVVEGRGDAWAKTSPIERCVYMSRLACGGKRCNRTSWRVRLLGRSRFGCWRIRSVQRVYHRSRSSSPGRERCEADERATDRALWSYPSHPCERCSAFFGV
jgi:hypothetical protein